MGNCKLHQTVTFGASYSDSLADFTQSTQFAYLTADRGVVGVTGPGAFADGTQQSENAFDARVDLHGRTANLGLYGTDSLMLTDALRLDLSARYDRTSIGNRDRITPAAGTGSLSGDHRFSAFNPALAIAWMPFKRLGFDAAIAQTSRAPSAIELGCSDPASPCRLPNALAGDPPLAQVTAMTLEVGVHGGARGPLIWRIGAFRSDSRNDILFVANDAAGFGYFRNFGRTRRQGVDMDVIATLGRVRLSGHYTWLDATYRSSERVGASGNSSNDGVAPGLDGAITIASGNRIPSIPRSIAKVAVAWDPLERLSLDLDMIAVSGVYARGNENNAHMADGVYYLGAGSTRPYAVVNFGAELRVTKAVTLTVQVNNLLDKKYATAAQLAARAFDGAGRFVARPFATPVIDGERPLVSSTFYAPGAPRSVQVSARIRL